MPRKKSKPAPLGASGWVSVLTAALFVAVVCFAIVLAIIPIRPSASLGGRLVNTAAALNGQLHEPDYRGFWIPLLIAVVVVSAAGAAASRARQRANVPYGRAVLLGISDGVIGLLFQILELLFSGSSRSRSSSSSSGGMTAGGGSFGGGGASGGW